jgi:hypothetical protein
MSASIAAVVEYLDRIDPEAAAVARERYGCLTPWQRDPATYGRAALTTGYAKCERPVLLALRDLLEKQLEYEARDRDSFLDAAQNARVIASAERYYRAMYYATAESWNLRDRHMFDTLNHLMHWRGNSARAVVWAHNSHVGNAAATDMGRSRDEINIGQLCREKFGDGAALIGFGTDRGTVAAVDNWGGLMKIKTVRPAHPESYEYLCRNAGIQRFLLDLRKGQRDELRSALMTAILQRAVGVIYRPETELASHYFDAHLPKQFDGYVWFEETTAIKPLPAESQEGLPRNLSIRIVNPSRGGADPGKIKTLDIAARDIAASFFDLDQYASRLPGLLDYYDWLGRPRTARRRRICGKLVYYSRRSAIWPCAGRSGVSSLGVCSCRVGLLACAVDDMDQPARKASVKY